jgi:hypothetical protein
VDSKEIKCPFQWWGKHEAMFPLSCLACQILGIVRSQIEIERIILLEMLFTIKQFKEIEFLSKK